LKKNNRFAGYMFLLPAALIYLSVIVVPAIYSFYLSFFKWNGVSPTKKFVGIKNYVNEILNDRTFAIAVKNNIVWVLLTMIFMVGIALLLALLINREFKGRVVFRGIFYFPYVLSGVIVGIIWSWIYHPQLGLITNIMNLLHLGEYSKAFLADTKTAFYAVFLAALWQGVGAPMILFLAGLQTIPKDLFEAANLDGANKFQTFISITIPMLRETFVIVFALQVISSVKVYDIVYAMTGGGPAQSTQVMATWMVTQSFRFSNVGVGTAIACIMVLVLMVVIIPFVLFMAKEE
jgi:raffinose/stachyose/melibiose transport system permease protein